MTKNKLKILKKLVIELFEEEGYKKGKIEIHLNTVVKNVQVDISPTE